MNNFLNDLNKMIDKVDKIKLDSYAVFLGNKEAIEKTKLVMQKENMNLSHVIFHESNYMQEDIVAAVTDDNLKKDFLKMHGINV